jgi:hypothetical protein
LNTENKFIKNERGRFVPNTNRESQHRQLATQV